jgi:hypothetical protein
MPQTQPIQLASLLAHGLISWRPLFTSSKTSRTIPWTWPDRRPSITSNNRASPAPGETDKGGPLTNVRHPSEIIPHGARSCGCSALSATRRETMGLVPSQGSVSKTRATLRAVWWFSRQGSERVERNGLSLRAQYGPSCWDRKMPQQNGRLAYAAEQAITGFGSDSSAIITWRTVGPAGQETRPEICFPHWGNEWDVSLAAFLRRFIASEQDTNHDRDV